MLTHQEARRRGYIVLGTAPLTPSVSEGKNSVFETDGGVLVLLEDGKSLPENTLFCLGVVREAEFD